MALPRAVRGAAHGVRPALYEAPEEAARREDTDMAGSARLGSARLLSLLLVAWLLDVRVIAILHLLANLARTI